MDTQDTWKQRFKVAQKENQAYQKTITEREQVIADHVKSIQVLTQAHTVLELG